MILDNDRVVNYRGLDHFLDKLKSFFIKNPKEKGEGKYLRCIDNNGNVEWAEFPSLLTYKGNKATYSQLPDSNNLPGDVWHVEENDAEYVWILNTDGTSYNWEYMGTIINLPNHAKFSDASLAGKVLVSKSNGSGGITYEWKDLPSTPSMEQNELIYSDDGNTYTTHPLMFTGALIVDNPVDLDNCKAMADVTMSTVYSEWDVFGGDASDRGKWGYCSSESPETTQEVTLHDGTLQEVPVYKYKNDSQGYIFNTKNTNYITGYYSKISYSQYDSIISAGIIPDLKEPSATDYMAIIPALYDGDDGFYGLSVSANNTIATGGDGRETVRNDRHTISLIAWKQEDSNTSISSPSGAIQLISNVEGQRISKYKSNLCNGNTNGIASTIQVRVQRRENIITVWASDPYATTEDDYNHRNDIHVDCPIIIDLASYKVSYTYRDESNVLTTVTKDFSDSSNLPTYLNGAGTDSSYTEEEVISIKGIFDKLKTSAKRGYEVCSNPGSMFRNCSYDELICDVTPGENKVYKYNGNDWIIQSITPQELFLNGSRIAWNRITDKLFYNDGASIYRIAAGSNSYTLPTATDSTKGGIKVGDGLRIDSQDKLHVDTAVSTLASGNTLNISYDSGKYIKVPVSNGDDLDINVSMQDAFSGVAYAKEIIVRITSQTSIARSPAVIRVRSSGVAGTLVNMFDTNLTNTVGMPLNEGETMELVFTFWDKNDVTFNGGVK